jgi:hypothetical protein
MSDTRIDENGVLTVTGYVDDAGSADVLTVTIMWGDGTTSLASVDQTTRSFWAEHRYLDDAPTGTPSDDYVVSLTVSDDDGAVTPASIGVLTVDNVAPTVETLVIAVTDPEKVDKNGPVTVTATIGDVGTLDTHTFFIDWGDGTTSTGVVDTTAPGAGIVIDDHIYGRFGEYTVTVTITDDDGGVVTETATACLRRGQSVCGDVCDGHPGGGSGEGGAPGQGHWEHDDGQEPGPGIGHVSYQGRGVGHSDRDLGPCSAEPAT